MNTTQQNNPSSLTPQSGTEWKKAALDALNTEVLDAQADVLAAQAIVDALTEKAHTYAGILATADDNRSTAQANWTTIQALAQQAGALQDRSSETASAMDRCQQKADALAIALAQVMDRLIYSVEIVNKLAILLVRSKALNPLIPDELLALVTTAGKDANNAIALTLTALRSVFATEAACLEVCTALQLESYQAAQLVHRLGLPHPQQQAKPGERPTDERGIYPMLHEVYQHAKTDYENAHDANNRTQEQLNGASVALRQAQVRLASLQAGYSAANAAANAS